MWVGIRIVHAQIHHDMMLLIGFGADGVCPYLAYETLAQMNAQGIVSARANQHFTDEELFYSYRKAAAKGINQSDYCVFVSGFYVC